ncbi:Crp/Fnr family transcriptional regulator [Thiohalophilus sp.]|uniref:Crp/Fnr family transcriptional regulator n=1 Tax=Thiohalophilus sp. TaxID=3028392 RepID=UPI002ACDA85D|nr:Crp/Fnr family transcriptional regulator [Thiohalophilus sp.]MDZ7661824.1 Crp/Fnr family transcriptional regulator [Thiohalophilus sp.]
MPGNNHVHSGNALLGILSPSVQRRFLADCTLVVLDSGKVLATSGKPLRHVYFPTRGYISLTAPVDGVAWLGIALIGDEGMLGSFTTLGIDVSPLNATVLGGGAALCMETTVFRRQLVANPGLRQVLNRYCYVLVSQLAQASFCNRFHQAEQRLARRLLMTQDRTHSDMFHVTQQALARVLGVRRPAVNAAASALQDRGLIRYRRGDLTILDRRGLKTIACSCYADDNAIYSGTMAGSW